MRIHRNLHAARQGKPQWVETRAGRVAAYLDSVTLLNVSTRIQLGGLKRCQENQVRQVCAYMDGELSAETPAGDWQRIAFDPRKDTHFLANGLPWNLASAVRLEADGKSYVLNPRLEE